MDKAKRLKMKLNKEKLKKQLQKSQELKATIQQTNTKKKDKSKINKTLVKKIIAEENKKNDKKNDDNLTPLQQKFKKKLAGAQFRWINEQLYTLDSNSAFKLINDKPELFSIYHEGFRSQVESWPSNPVDIFINQIKQIKGPVVIADMGCGDAKIAQTFENDKQKTIHSFDLISENKYVTACDISKTPLKKNSVDIVIFCLSLMGVNFIQFLKEAHRILKPGAELKIAEVVSRFTDMKEFISTLSDMGFKLTKKNDKNKMFVLFEFKKLSKNDKNNKKNNNNNQESDKVLLKPCLYKKR
ncbi:hypothetical protein BCR32DRAFT_236744 [Anaeromyces robustus]|uniref:Ribosomal RNA-processing protein 8 n=1 Tax=Anaeromyces robustus TaxID=1754192 RepID=A0A1Y1WRM5_9FUNG|nr:hypothetical protein BCR32DRAFT_236744 [Anaeromyces robustus]|eukprot:ORX76201.1 hypothetical protein BCR32DRAFT_236744 [Anaeromyces robustus]